MAGGESTTGQPDHLIVLVNGLFGNSAHWEYVKTQLADSLGSSKTIIHASVANQLLQTYAGIDTCGERLAHELEELIAGIPPSVRRISFIGHSMGGLICRVAIARLYDPGCRTVAGLEPQHFVSMATPHVGFDPEHGSAEIPLCMWLSETPVVGQIVGPMLHSVAPMFASTMFGRSGEQFFLRDTNGNLPLLYRMSLDHHTDTREQYISSLASFKTRTAYANRSGDHLVGWANSSLRFSDELVKLKMSIDKGLGVVREDPLEFSWTNRGQVEATSSQHPQLSKDMINASMERLRCLGWRRIDVCFKDSNLPLLAHQHIMVQRPAINSAGNKTAQHLAEQLFLMEQHMPH